MYSNKCYFLIQLLTNVKTHIQQIQDMNCEFSANMPVIFFYAAILYGIYILARYTANIDHMCSSKLAIFEFYFILMNAN